ncbi:hypothetical protein [Neobacillus ginsengisoli]|uniref:YtxH domain-containing protein n=1 Tax=Neobacillus ginsengisoli TaxID=904295 RepID=A0ABT9XU78_9BACI|nr:hypothetical protein [Neobacillus ginsengisoli]MDQ0199113.1 hypothetical protein [Neobacillus ginsengisoli]
MFKRLFSLSNPLGIAFTAAALILTLSPEARKGTRKVLVKGAAALLSVGDQVKGLTVGARKEIGHIVEDAKVEKEQMVLPDFSEMIKNAGDSTKTKMNQVFDDMKINVEKATSGLAHGMEMSNELVMDNLNDVQENVVHNPVPAPKKIKKTNINKNKNMSMNKNVPNVLSNKAYNSLVGKSPFES